MGAREASGPVEAGAVVKGLPGLFRLLFSLWWRDPASMASAFMCSVSGNDRAAQKHILRAMEKRNG